MRGRGSAAHLRELLVLVGETVHGVVEDFLHQTLLVVWNTVSSDSSDPVR